MDIRDMYSQWHSLAKQWQAPEEELKAVFNLLRSAYSDPGRHYHGIRHIENMLKLAQQHKAEIQHWDAFFFAVWFHDFIQQKRGNNEEMSALVAKEYLPLLHVPEQIIHQVEQLIMATLDHDPEADGDSRLFVDIDLAILGADRADYKSYAFQCRKEYFLPSFIYRIGRRKFLKDYLNKPSIFHSDYFQAHYEKKARANMKWELEAWV